MIKSNEKKLIIFEEFLDLRKHFSWINKLSKHNIHCYMSSSLSNHDNEIIDKIIKSGIKVTLDLKYQPEESNYVVVDNHKINNKLLSLIKNEAIISFWDTFAGDCLIFDNRKNIILCQCSRQIDNFLKKNNIPTQVCKKSSYYNAQSIELSENIIFTIAGNSFPYCLDDKSEQDNAFEGFNDKLSTVLFYNDESLRAKQVKTGLEKLSQFYNVIVLSDAPVQVKAKNTIVLTYQNLPKVIQSASCHLIPVNSDYLVFSMMHGLPVVPVFTRYFDILNKGGRYLPDVSKVNKQHRFVSFTSVLSKESLSAALCEYCIPVDIENTTLLKYYLSNSVYWKKYKAHIQEAVHKELGVYYTTKAEQVTKNILVNLLQYDVPVIMRKVF